MKKRQGPTLAAMEGLTVTGLGCIFFACEGAARAGAKLVFPVGCALGAGAVFLWRKRGGLRGYSSFKRLWAALILQGAAGILALALELWPLTALAGLAFGGSAYLFAGAYGDVHKAFRAFCRIAPGEKGRYRGFAALWSLPVLGTLGVAWRHGPIGFLRAVVCVSFLCGAGSYLLLEKSLCLSDQRGGEICRKGQETIKKI